MEPNRIICGDCVEILAKAPEPFADLIFADPPFNIGYKYDVYEDRKAHDDYYAWTEKWMRACYEKALKPTGSFWVAIGDEYAAEVKIIGDSLGLHLRNWVIWHYTFGQNTKRKFARSHAHLFYWVKDREDFAFNAEAVGVLSDRQKEYADKRANPLGRVPFDVWYEFPRVCGTFSERQCWHPCQMPEMLLARIVRACTNRGDLVFDPFAGSGTTLVTAKKLSRTFAGTEISRKYVKQILRRLASTKEPRPILPPRSSRWPEGHRDELAALYVENGVPTDRLHTEPTLWIPFVQQFNVRMENVGFEEGYTSGEIWIQLERLRKAGKLGRVRVHGKESTGGKIRAPGPPGLFD